MDQCFKTWVSPSVSVLESWVPAMEFVIEGAVEEDMSKSQAGVVFF